MVTNILQAHPEPIDGIFAANGDMALGAVVAAKDAGRLSEFWTIGIDCSPEELTSIKGGEETACWAWKPSGKEGIQTVKAYLDGEDYYPLVVAPTYMVDKNNVATSQPAWGASTAPAAPATDATPAAACSGQDWNPGEHAGRAAPRRQGRRPEARSQERQELRGWPFAGIGRSPLAADYHQGFASGRQRVWLGSAGD